MLATGALADEDDLTVVKLGKDQTVTVPSGTKRIKVRVGVTGADQQFPGVAANTPASSVFVHRITWIGTIGGKGYGSTASYELEVFVPEELRADGVLTLQDPTNGKVRSRVTLTR